MGKRWNQRETDILREMYQINHIDEICEVLGRKRHAIYDRVARLKIQRPDDWRKLNCPIPVGPDTRFKKGQPSWNKGMKLGSDWGKATQFKKGQEAHNKLPPELRELTKELSRLKKNIYERERRYAKR